MNERYSLTQHDDGSWSVIDGLLDGPAELNGVVLQHLSRDDAALLCAALRRQDEELKARLDEVLYKGPRG
ncbi:hypothetical protein DVH29_15010 [Pelagibacterium lacus]|uniref:Uncharacterized protein n=1 Tax=Pelagibacterium lacus TaxID=2282655 RepID=A0A369W066_9HYPH|nr:hypothetical protein DVH29_15010 [Pelagibacterium lacus]